ncbi:MAG: hypothetical protein ACYS22_12870 [Planctomycetota bacterium]|jgi:outer membrane biosynthesis protein TonB
MSEKTFLITYTGTDIVELDKAGLFGPNVSAFVDAATADAAKKHGSFTVAEKTAGPIASSTREDLDAATQKEMAAHEPDTSKVPDIKPEPEPEPKPEPKPAPQAEAKAAPAEEKKEEKKADDKPAAKDDAKADAKAPAGGK